MGALFGSIMKMIGGSGGSGASSSKGGSGSGMLQSIMKNPPQSSAGAHGIESYQDMTGGAQQQNPIFAQIMQSAMQQAPQQQHQQIQPAQMQMPVAQQHSTAQNGMQPVTNSNIDLSALLKLLSGG
jgi:hypothetical protein